MKKDLIDSEGNVIPPPDATSDVAQLIYLLEYCRQRSFVLGPTVQVRDVVVQVKDPTLERSRSAKTPEPTIWQEHGFNDRGDE